MQEFEVYIGSYRDSLLASTQVIEQIVNTGGLCDVKYVSMAYIERYVYVRNKRYQDMYVKTISHLPKHKHKHKRETEGIGVSLIAHVLTL